jgi:hypothetical protein
LEKATWVAFFLGARTALNSADTGWIQKKPQQERTMNKTNDKVDDNEAAAPVRKPSKGI